MKKAKYLLLFVLLVNQQIKSIDFKNPNSNQNITVTNNMREVGISNQQTHERRAYVENHSLFQQIKTLFINCIEQSNDIIKNKIINTHMNIHQNVTDRINSIKNKVNKIVEKTYKNEQEAKQSLSDLNTYLHQYIINLEAEKTETEKTETQYQNLLNEINEVTIQLSALNAITIQKNSNGIFYMYIPK